jgi:hypothetical protein
MSAAEIWPLGRGLWGVYAYFPTPTPLPPL